MTTVQSLTKEQEARFPEFVDKWTKIGLCTDPANRSEAERGIINAYKSAKLQPPQSIVWCESPLSMIITKSLLKSAKETLIGNSVFHSVRASVWNSVSDSVRASVLDSVLHSVRASVLDSVLHSVRTSVWASVEDSVRDSVKDSVWDSVRDSVKDSVWDSVKDSVFDSVWDSVGNSVSDSAVASVGNSVGSSVSDSVKTSVRNSVRTSVWNSVWASVRASVEDSIGASVLHSVRTSVRASVWNSVFHSVRASVWNSVSDSVRASVEDSIGASVWDSVYGQHDASWMSFYDYFGEACGLREIVSPLDNIMTVARNAGWWLPCENTCFVSERHNVCRVDDRGRIHCEDGPAIEYPDGFAIYGWHGTRVPENWIKEKDKLTPEEVLKCENVEQRAAGLAIIGMRKFLDHLPHKIVDSSVNPQIGDLIEITLPGFPESELYLKFLCPRNGEMMEPVNKRELEKADLHHAHAWHSRIPARLFSFAQQRS